MFSEPVIGEKFFGREEVLELLNKRVLALKDGYRQNIALTGQSLSGKSSIILHFLHIVNSEGFIPVYVEVIKEPFRTFANKFIATVFYNSLKKMGEAVEADMQRLTEIAQKRIPKTSQIAKQVNAFIDKGDPEEAYMALLGLTSVLKEEAGLSCVVILDEFDNLEHLGIKNPFLSFGKVIMVQKDTMYIVSSSRNEAIKKIISEKLSLLFGNFEVVKVANFDTRTAARLIDIKFSGFDTSVFLKKFLVMFTDGNPFYLSKLISRVREIAIEKPSTCIDEEIVARAILDLVYHANGVIHQYLMTFMLSILDTKTRDGHLSILTAIAEGYNTQSKIARGLKSKHGDISKSLARLVELGLLSKNGIFYEIEDAMFSFWLKSVYQRRKDLLVDGTFDKMEFFRKDILASISAYEKECAKPAPQRIAELFNLFSNELVSIDSKHIRLPHFTKVEIKASNDPIPMIMASFRGNSWAARIYERAVNENDVIVYIKDLKMLGGKVSNKLLLAMGGIDENAKLIAKELKITVLDGPAVNKLLTFYGMKRMIVL
ncbi:MAG: ATP-binding protein [Candidatus Omnitrophica bacterium]|nr:ATP-binding protein [Candidatus Omnitrophota bacterium]